MEQQQRSLIFTATVGLIILAIIVGSIYYLVKFIQSRVSSTAQTPQASVEEIAGASTSPEDNIEGAQITPNTGTISPQASSAATSGTTGNPPADRKIYNGGDFQLVYPNNWGLLTCSNSKNLEFDPNNRADAKVACDVAVKAVTVVVGDNQGCSGENAKLGNVDVTRSKNSDNNYVKYQWCTKTSPALNITHRVSEGGERATSRQDMSKQIEEIISKLTFARGS